MMNTALFLVLALFSAPTGDRVLDESAPFLDLDDAYYFPDLLPLQAALLPGPKFGVHMGYFSMRDAVDPDVFYGLHARFSILGILAIEGSVDFAEADFEDADGELRIVPVQVTGLIFPFPLGPLNPYVLAGAGLYYTTVDYSGAQAAYDDETESFGGVHVGGGAELSAGLLKFHVDVRYVFIDEPGVDNSQLEDEEFDYWQVIVGVSLGF